MKKPIPHTLALVLCLCACSDDAPPQPPGDPQPVVLTLRNDTDAVLWVQAVPTSTKDSWYAVLKEDRYLDVVDQCDLCNCGDEICSSCHATVPRSKSVQPGTEVSWTWEGFQWLPGLDNGATCERPIYQDRGEYVARLCWGHSLELEFLGGENVTEVECIDLPFEYGKETEVVHTVSGVSAEPTPREIELVNDTDQPMFVQRNLGCGITDWWVQFTRHGLPLQVKPQCGYCSCSTRSECLSDECPPCPPANITEVAPGDSIVHQWNGQNHVIHTEDNTQCQADLNTPTDGNMIQFCYGFESIQLGDGIQVANEQCKRFAIPDGDTTYRHVVSELP